MTNPEQNQKPASATVPANAAPEAATQKNNAEKINAEIKKSWNRLSDDDVKLYEKQPDQFFSKLKEKHNVSKEDATKRLSEIKSACGNVSEKAA